MDEPLWRATMMSTILAVSAIGLAALFDRLAGEFPTRFHPVAWFGRLVSLVDREWGSSAVLIGFGVALFFPLIAAGVSWAVVAAGVAVNPWIGVLVAAAVLFTTTSLQSLLEMTTRVLEDVERESATVHDTIRGLVGRETSSLSPAELRSGAIESAAENLADGFVGPLLPFALLAPISLPLGAAAATWVKAVNTLDSMLGYPEKAVGTGSARLDDAVMWVPARLSALLLALAAFEWRSLLRAREWSQIPASPNSGWPMATLAAILDVRLEKHEAYVLNGSRPLPTAVDGRRAVVVVRRAGWLAVVGAMVVALSAGVSQ